MSGQLAKVAAQRLGTSAHAAARA